LRSIDHPKISASLYTKKEENKINIFLGEIPLFDHPIILSCICHSVPLCHEIEVLFAIVFLLAIESLIEAHCVKHYQWIIVNVVDIFIHKTTLVLELATITTRVELKNGRKNLRPP
jgi:hypothetical protein